MIYFKKSFKYNIKEFICYKKEIDSINFLIKVIIEFNNKLYKLAIKTHYSNPDVKARTY